MVAAGVHKFWYGWNIRMLGTKVCPASAFLLLAKTVRPLHDDYPSSCYFPYGGTLSLYAHSLFLFLGFCDLLHQILS
jgi:hypothetical protein